MTTLDDLDDLGDTFQRETAECPVCNGTIREMRNSDRWLCDDCARYIDPENANQ